MSDTPKLNTEQAQAFEAIKEFLDHPEVNTFVLKGYAGTGKTFLMQYLGKWLEEKEIDFRMLATTGRAATVLRGKTGFDTRTIHSEIYSFDKIDGIEPSGFADKAEDLFGQLSMQFLLRGPDEEKTVYIVDEASMISGEATTDPSFATFGSGVLLDDLFAVAGQNKIIFVGDPAQLPPVRQQISPALDVGWLASRGRPAASFSLQKIERTDAGNDILQLAGAIRQMGSQEQTSRFMKLPARALNNVKLHHSDKQLFNTYLQAFKSNGTNNTLAIARSNRMVQNINRAMRRDLYGSSNAPLQVGDILLVTQNNYKVPLSNGDFVKVLELGEVSQRSGLHFQRIKVKAAATDLNYDVLLSLDALHSLKGNLTEDQLKALMMDYSGRMLSKNIAPNTSDYNTLMMQDEYLNCLRASYGYAVTCHKAQGGEWGNVFLFLEKSMYSMDPPELCKWWYTSVTRARQELNLAAHWWVA